MPFLKDVGIVLRKRAIRERDEIITLLTLEHGKQHFMSFGSRMPKSKKAAPLQLFNTIEFQARKSKKGLFSFDQIKLINSRAFPMLEKKNLDFFYRASAITVYAEKFLPEGALAKEVFLHLSFALDHIQEEAAAIFFEIKILTDLGYLPDFKKCWRCHVKLNLQNEICFSTENRGFAHQKCCQQSSDNFSVSSDMLRVMAYVQKNPLEKAMKVHVKKELQKEIKSLLEKIEVH